MDKVYRPVPCKVIFKYPDEVVRTGEVVDATKIRYHKTGKGEAAEYATRVELIKFDGEKGNHIRFAY